MLNYPCISGMKNQQYIKKDIHHDQVYFSFQRYKDSSTYVNQQMQYNT
jgi:hypothetical protein